MLAHIRYMKSLNQRNLILVFIISGILILFFQRTYKYNDGTSPIIFIGGSYRSGTTLMRVMLDAHPLIRCGEETRIVPRFLEFMARNFQKDKKLQKAGLTTNMLDQAARAFISSIVSLHGKSAPNLCTKDPENLRHSMYLSQLFPNSKFILMIRDARATINSIKTHGLLAGGYSRGYQDNFKNWNSLIEEMYSQCLTIGDDRCLPVYYEQLVLHPEYEMRKILKFLNIPWNDDVLEHEKKIGAKIKLAEIEISSDQVIKPVNLEGLNSWFGKIPLQVLNQIDTLAPMLKKLGYDTKSKKPNYSKADIMIRESIINNKNNRQMWIEVANNYTKDKFYKYFN
jgi:protein-tyrosine sulfotransferase